MADQPAPARTTQLVRIDLVDEAWVFIALTNRMVEGRVRRISLYRYGRHPGHCFFICLGMRAHDLMGFVAEVSLEEDEGGPVVTVYRVLRDAQHALPSLSALIWPRRMWNK